MHRRSAGAGSAQRRVLYERTLDLDRLSDAAAHRRLAPRCDARGGYDGAHFGHRQLSLHRAWNDDCDRAQQRKSSQMNRLIELTGVNRNTVHHFSCHS